METTYVIIRLRRHWCRCTAESAERSGLVGEQPHNPVTECTVCTVISATRKFQCTIIVHTCRERKDFGWTTGGVLMSVDFCPCAVDSSDRPTWRGWTYASILTLNVKLWSRFKIRRWPSCGIMTVCITVTFRFHKGLPNRDGWPTYKGGHLQRLYFVKSALSEIMWKCGFVSVGTERVSCRIFDILKKVCIVQRVTTFQETCTKALHVGGFVPGLKPGPWVNNVFSQRLVWMDKPVQDRNLSWFIFRYQKYEGTV